MKKNHKNYISLFLLSLLAACSSSDQKITVEIFETSANGNQLKEIETSLTKENAVLIQILPEQKYQTIIGFGGSFTEASASLLNRLSPEKRQQVLEAYFGKEGADYTLTRTHMGSCDFSLSNYSYAPVENDQDLNHFSIDEDLDDIIPMIRDAQMISEDGFKIISSPWTAPPWMKDNHDWKGGKLLPGYYNTWAMYFSKYLEACKNEGIPIWGITVENEPLGNNNNWESMHFTAGEMAAFVLEYLGPALKKDHPDVKMLAYDQNRGKELEEWAKVFYGNPESAKYVDGFAVHWYASTIDWFSESLNFTHNMAPGKYIIQTEACVDAEVPHWNDDNWYWSKEATDWGWDWATDDQKYLHPKYVPVYRYARDIIGCLNNWVNGWIDWNMVLDRQGGPNWAGNWCIAPVIADPSGDEVYFTPLFYTLAHFSKFIRPGAVRIGFVNPDPDLMITSAQNPDGSVVTVILNPNKEAMDIQLQINETRFGTLISGNAIQTIVLKDSK